MAPQRFWCVVLTRQLRLWYRHVNFVMADLVQQDGGAWLVVGQTSNGMNLADLDEIPFLPPFTRGIRWCKLCLTLGGTGRPQSAQMGSEAAQNARQASRFEGTAAHARGIQQRSIGHAPSVLSLRS